MKASTAFCKFSNKIISQRFLAREGGVETLIAFGFTPHNSERNGKSLILIDDEEASHDIFLALETGLTWFHGQWPIYAPKCCKQSICMRKKVLISFRMPVGPPIIGGFMKEETISSVVNYVSNFFSGEKGLVSP